MERQILLFIWLVPPNGSLNRSTDIMHLAISCISYHRVVNMFQCTCYSAFNEGTNDDDDGLLVCGEWALGFIVQQGLRNTSVSPAAAVGLLELCQSCCDTLVPQYDSLFEQCSIVLQLPHRNNDVAVNILKGSSCRLSGFLQTDCAHKIRHRFSRLFLLSSFHFLLQSKKSVRCACDTKMFNLYIRVGRRKFSKSLDMACLHLSEAKTAHILLKWNYYWPKVAKSDFYRTRHTWEWYDEMHANDRCGRNRVQPKWRLQHQRLRCESHVIIWSRWQFCCLV